MSDGIVAVTMPKWGIEMTEGAITAWNFSEGQHVNKGDGLLDVETEKIVNAVESPASGTLRRILAQPGETKPVGSLIAVFADSAIPDAAIDAFVSQFRGASVNFELDASTAPASSSANASSEGAEDSADGEPRVSPIARRLAEKLGIDVAQVRGTGRNGRVSKEDVEKHAAARATTSLIAENPQTRLRLSPTRLTIARRLLESTQTIPHYRLAAQVDVSQLLLRRATLADESGARVTINDLLLRACALALLRHPALNAQLQGDELVQFAHADISIAVATEHGLITPILRAVDTKSLTQVAAESAVLIDRALRGALARGDISGGSFTVSNLGMHGIAQFDAIINPPQVAILAVGAAMEGVIARNGGPAVTKLMTLTLSADHRVIDGAVGADFLATLQRLIEHPDEL